MDVIVVTGDRDSYQLVRDPYIKVLYNKRGVSDYALYDEAGILERTGVTPLQYGDYAALRGDTSDNLPGVPGIGEKTAAKLINAYGNLEGIFEHLDDLPPKQKQNLGRVPRPGLPQPGDVGPPYGPGPGVRAGRPADGRLGPRDGPRPLRAARVPHPVPPPARSDRRRGGGHAEGRDPRSDGALPALRRRDRGAPARSRGARRALRDRTALGRAGRARARCRGTRGRRLGRGCGLHPRRRPPRRAVQAELARAARARRVRRSSRTGPRS